MKGNRYQRFKVEVQLAQVLGFERRDFQLGGQQADQTPVEEQQVKRKVGVAASAASGDKGRVLDTSGCRRMAGLQAASPTPQQAPRVGCAGAIGL